MSIGWKNIAIVILGLVLIVEIFFLIPSAYQGLDERKAACAEAGGKLMRDNICMDKDIFIDYMKDK